MNFYSTNQKARPASFKEAIYQSLPPDNGLYFPETIPTIRKKVNPNLSLPEIGFEVMKPFAKDDLTSAELLHIVEDALNFSIPLIEVENNIHSLELFHGPTYAFKDVGARFLARCLSTFNTQSNREVTILVATSGDTGGAVASGFYKVPGVEVIILYPSGKVSELQEKQLTTLGENITALEVDGDFDACQSLVKSAFLDDDLKSAKNLSSANSINIARWIPQSIYYWWLSLQTGFDPNLVISVPSGNYGNIAAGLLAKKMGVPIKRFIAASNVNNVVPRYLETGKYLPTATIATYSNAMDVGNPSNFPRILELYGKAYTAIVQEISGGYLSDNETLDTMRSCLEKNNYQLDPHGAIGYQLLVDHLKEGETGAFLETAHPCKFLPVIHKINPTYTVPPFANNLLEKEKKSVKISHHFEEFKTFLLN